MAFVTFESINHARRVLRDHKFSILVFRHNPPTSSINIIPNVSKKNYDSVKIPVPGLYIMYCKQFYFTLAVGSVAEPELVGAGAGVKARLRLHLK